VITHTRTHVYVTFANPYLVCAECRESVPSWHDAGVCGCDAGPWNMPCKHMGVTGLCPSWSPVGGCTCTEPHRMPRGIGRRTEEDTLYSRYQAVHTTGGYRDYWRRRGL
jgi:hypothetical protein